MARLLDVTLSVLSAVAAVGMAFTATCLDAFGPRGIVPSWVITAVVAGLWINILLIVVFGSGHNFGFHWLSIVATAVSFFGMVIAANSAVDAVDAQAFKDRGRVAVCTITALREYTRTERDTNGDTTTTTYYEHAVNCPGSYVSKLTTTDEAAGRRWDRISILYDPTRRLAPQPTKDLPADVAGPTRTGLIALGLAMLASGVVELTPGDSFFGGYRRGLERVRFGSTVFCLVILATVIVVGVYHVAEWSVGTCLDGLGVPRGVLHVGWVSWAVGLCAGLFLNYFLNLLRKIGVVVLRRFSRFLDPREELSGLLAELDIDVTFQFPVFCGHLFIDAGFLGFLIRSVRSRLRRGGLRRRFGST